MADSPADSASPLVNTPWAANFLDVRASTMSQWRWKGGGPPFVRLSARAIRYRLADLEEFVADRVVASTSEPDGGNDAD